MISLPRTAREISHSGIYHIMLRGINKQNIFEETEDYEKMRFLLQQNIALGGMKTGDGSLSWQMKTGDGSLSWQTKTRNRPLSSALIVPYDFNKRVIVTGKETAVATCTVIHGSPCSFPKGFSPFTC